MIDKTAFIAISTLASGVVCGVAGAVIAYQESKIQQHVEAQNREMRDSFARLHNTIRNLNGGMKPTSNHARPQ